MKAAKKRSLRRAREAPSGRFSGRSRRAQSIGVRVRDTTRDTRIAAERVTANSRNNRPVRPPMSSSGMNTATSESVIDNTVKPTWRAPVIAAWIGGSPSSMRRAMFSTTTMASSTTKPVAMISAISDRLFRLKSHRYMTAKVPISETGTARLGISVARPLRRNRKTTRITSATEISRVSSASSSDARIDGLRSSITFSLTCGPSSSCNTGSCAWMASVASMMLAPGWRVTISSTAGRSSEKPALRTSSTESLTLATSPRRTAAPLSAL
ncbi:Uncharacterised protein [Enterobacter cloacae]|nr:Uncharacterised protein [Enterobacter cloacae]